MITDAQIMEAFRGTNFGYGDGSEIGTVDFHRQLLEQGVLKKLVRYHSGHTLTQILIKLGLITEKLHVTIKGKEFIYEAFYEERYSG